MGVVLVAGLLGNLSPTSHNFLIFDDLICFQSGMGVTDHPLKVKINIKVCQPASSGMESETRRVL